MSRHSCCCECDSDIDSFDVDELVDEINGRLCRPKHGEYDPSQKVRLIYADDLDVIRRAILAGTPLEAVWLLEQSILPKWRTVQECQRNWAEFKKPPPREGLWQHAV